MYVPRPYMHPRARIRSPRRTASRCSAECAVARRLVDGLPRQLVPLPAVYRDSSGRCSRRRVCTIATWNKTSHRAAQGCGPLQARSPVGSRRNAGCYRLSFFRPLPRSSGDVQEFEFCN